MRRYVGKKQQYATGKYIKYTDQEGVVILIVFCLMPIWIPLLGFPLLALILTAISNLHILLPATIIAWLIWKGTR